MASMTDCTSLLKKSMKPWVFIRSLKTVWPIAYISNKWLTVWTESLVVIISQCWLMSCLLAMQLIQVFLSSSLSHIIFIIHFQSYLKVSILPLFLCIHFPHQRWSSVSSSQSCIVLLHLEAATYDQPTYILCVEWTYMFMVQLGGGWLEGCLKGLTSSMAYLRHVDMWYWYYCCS